MGRLIPFDEFEKVFPPRWERESSEKKEADDKSTEPLQREESNGGK